MGRSREGQWMVAREYGNLIEVDPDSSVVQPLVRMPTYTDIDPHALEDAVEEDFLIHRIVGQIFVQTSEPIDNCFFGWRLMALEVNLNTGAMETPWPAGSTIMRDPDIANEPRWWGERYYATGDLPGGVLLGLDVVDNPWWTMVDLKTKALCGPGQGDHEYPVLVLEQSGGPAQQQIQVVHRLRMWVTLQGRK